MIVTAGLIFVKKKKKNSIARTNNRYFRRSANHTNPAAVQQDEEDGGGDGCRDWKSFECYNQGYFSLPTDHFQPRHYILRGEHEK